MSSNVRQHIFPHEQVIKIIAALLKDLYMNRMVEHISPCIYKVDLLEFLKAVVQVVQP